jgi:hypothetical protein
MKRFSIILLAIAVAFVMALPAGAKGKPDKPPKPPASAPIAVYLDAEPIWVHEGGDVLRYTVTLQNKTSADIVDITVRFSAATTAEDVDEITEIVVPANEYMIVPFVTCRGTCWISLRPRDAHSARSASSSPQRQCSAAARC